MVCNYCGNQIQDNQQICPNCGANLGITPPQNQPSYGNVQPNYAPSSTGISTSIIAKIVVVIALICFFFTFMSVSCTVVDDSSVEITGIDMIIGNTETADEVNSASDDEASGIDVINIFVIGSAVLAILAIVMKNPKDSAALTVGSAALLIIFRFTATSYYKIEDVKLKEMIDEDLLAVEFGLALYAAIILFIVATILFSSDKKS